MATRQGLVLRSLPLNALRAFEASARHLSFAAAAAELCVTPAAVSHQISALEERVGQQLFVRHNRVVELSPSGLKLAAPLTELFAELSRVVMEVSGEDLSWLEVSAMPSFAAKWLAPRLSRFTIRHPDCRVRLVGADTLVDFRRERIDIGIRYGPGAYKGVHVECLAEVTAFPVASPTFARMHRKGLAAPKGLLRLPLLHDEASLIAANLPNWTRWLEAAGIDYEPVAPGLVFDSVHMAIEAALVGHGLALGLSPLVDDDVAVGRLVRPFALAVTSPFSFWLVCRRTRANSTRIRQFREWIHAELALSRAPMTNKAPLAHRSL